MYILQYTEDRMKTENMKEGTFTLSLFLRESESVKVQNRLGSRYEAAALVNEMAARFGPVVGIQNAIGCAGYYRPRIAALQDAFKRGVI